MIGNTQPDALRLANEFKLCNEYDSIPSMNDIAKAEAELRRQHARIAELEQQLVAEAAKTAAEKLRADQMTEQHRMQAAMHAQATKRVSALEASRIAYASEFELNADGEPDVGSIHANIRALKSQLSAPRQCLHQIVEPAAATRHCHPT